MGESAAIPFPEWNGEYVQHLTVGPDGIVYVVPSGAHERLHWILIGDQDIAGQFENPRLRGTKVELALAGWVQFQSDELTDRVNVDAPDGFQDESTVRRFARLHDAGSIAIAFYPSLDVQTSNTPEQLALSRGGDRIPVSLCEMNRADGVGRSDGSGEDDRR